MEEWAFLFDLVFSYLETCHKTWVVLQKLKRRPNYPESRQKFLDIVIPGIHKYAVLLCKLAFKHLDRDGATFLMKRWVSGTSSVLEEFTVPINRLKLGKAKTGINLDLKRLSQFRSLENTNSEVLYDRNISYGLTKRVRFDAALPDLPELVPDLAQAAAVCAEDAQDSTGIVLNPLYLVM